MRSKQTIPSLLLASILLLSNAFGGTPPAFDEQALRKSRLNIESGSRLDFSPAALLEKYRDVELRPGVGLDYRDASPWQLTDLRTDSVDFGWAKEFGSQTMPSVDHLSSMTADADGNIYVTGTSDFDWLTIKYAADGSVAWSEFYVEAGVTDTYGEDILVDDQGNVYVSGYRWGPFIDSDILVLKYDQSGTFQWMAEFAGAGLNNDFPNAMDIDADGNIIIGGYSYNASLDADFATIKIDPSGTVLWDAVFNGSGYANDWIVDLSIHADGSVFVGGTTRSEDTNDDYAIIKYAPDGTMVFTTLFDGITSTDILTSIALDPAGLVYATGVSQHYDGFIDYFTFKLDSAGAEAWSNRFGLPGSDEGDSWAADIVVDTLNNVTVTGVSYIDVYGFDYVTVQYDSSGTQSWVSRYSSTMNNGYDEATCAVLDHENNVIIAGLTASADGTDDIATVKYDTSGTELWAHQFAGGEGSDDVAFYLAVDDANSVFVAGSATTNLNLENYSVIEYSSDGTLVWEEQYDGPGNSQDIARMMATDGQSNIYIAGVIVSPESGSDISLIKYDTTGVLEWSIVFNGADNRDDIPNDIITDPSGNVIITGYTETVSNDRDAITFMYSPDGDLVWSTTYNGPGSNSDGGNALAVDMNGHIYVAGYSSGVFTNWDYATIKYDGLGNEVWVALYIGPNSGSDAASDIALDEDGNVYVTGSSHQNGTNRDYATVKYDFLGAQAWVARHNGAVNSDDYATALGVDGNGNVYVTGYTVGANINEDITTIKYTSSGEEAWVQNVNSDINSDDRGTHLAVDRRGNVVVSGSTYNMAGNMDFITIMYDRLGTEQWTSTHDGSGHTNDLLKSMTRDGTGAIYVTGRTVSDLGSFDYTTIKYDASGSELWSREYTGAGYSIDDPSDVVVDARGTVWVTGTTHYFYLGDYDWSHILTVQYLQPEYPVSIAPVLPQAYSLEQNFPNPFNPQTTIQYQLPEAQDVFLVIYNIQGQQVVSLDGGYKMAGRYSLDWDARDYQGVLVSAGVYFCRLQTSEFSQTIKMIYLK